MVRAAQKGEAKATSPEVARTAASIKIKDAKKQIARLKTKISMMHGDKNA